MKRKLLLILLISLVALVSGACTQTDSGETETPVKTEVTTDGTLPTAIPQTPEGYPLPQQQPANDPEGYPGPESGSPPQGGTFSAYPEIEDGGELTWGQAHYMILQGFVAQVSQEHSQKVILTLKDGRTLITFEPNLDDVFNLVKVCGEKCQDIVLVTE